MKIHFTKTSFNHQGVYYHDGFRYV